MPKNATSRPLFMAYCIYGLAALFLCYALILQVSPSVIIQSLMRDFGITATGLGLIASVYFYTYTILQIPVGLLYDRYSPRILITLALILTVWGVLFFGVSNGITLAIIGRLCMGAGCAFAFLGLLVIAARWFPPHYFAFLVGIAEVLVALGAIVGQVPFAALVGWLGWQGAVQSIAIIGALLALIAWLFLQEAPIYPPQVKVKFRESFHKSIFEVLKNPQSWWAALYAFLNWAPLVTFAGLWGVPFFMKLYGISAESAGSLCAVIWIGLGIAAPILGLISHRIRKRRLLLNFCALLGFFSSVMILYVPLSMASMFIFLLFFGMATAGQIFSFVLIRVNNRPEVTATAIGFNNMVRAASGALFQPIVGFLLQLHWNDRFSQGVPIYTLADYQTALMAIPFCFLVSGIISQFFIYDPEETVIG